MYAKYCKKCGNCCRTLPCPVFPKDLQRLSNYFKLPIEQMITKYFTWNKHGCDPFKYVLFPKRKGDTKTIGDEAWCYDQSRPCLFLNEKTNRCTIYSVRPTGAVLGICTDIRPEKLKKAKDGYEIMAMAIDAWNHHPRNPKFGIPRLGFEINLDYKTDIDYRLSRVKPVKKAKQRTLFES